MKTTGFLSRILGIAAVLAALLTTTLAAAPTSSAAPATKAPAASPDVAAKTAQRAAGCRRVCYGSIAVNTKTGYWAYATNYASKSKAISSAKKRCNNASDNVGVCRKAVWVRNACMAVAYRFYNGELVEWQGRWDNRLKAAKAKAKKAVRGPGKERIWGSACTAN